MGFFDKIKESLTKTRSTIGQQMNLLFSNFRRVDDELLDELLEILISADIGYELSESIISDVKREAKIRNINSSAELQELLIEIISKEMDFSDVKIPLNTKPSVIMLVGVNGTGKTTTCAKLANLYKNSGKKVILAAADTFRAAAGEQLNIWADRIGVDIVRHREGGDPAAVVFDSISAAVSRGADIVICDTAGRLHNKKNLMDELTKINRVIERELPDADKAVFLVLDSTTGQNAVNQAKEFMDAVNFSGIILTKLDGTAKGGMAISIKRELGVPILYIGTGEKIDDFSDFNAELFARGLFE